MWKTLIIMNYFCNICNNNNTLSITNAIDNKIFQECVKLCIPDMVFSTDVSLHLCVSCYDTLNAFNRFRQLCTKNEENMKRLYKTIKTEQNDINEDSAQTYIDIDQENQIDIKVETNDDHTFNRNEAEFENNSLEIKNEADDQIFWNKNDAEFENNSLQVEAKEVGNLVKTNIEFENDDRQTKLEPDVCILNTNEAGFTNDSPQMETEPDKYNSFKEDFARIIIKNFFPQKPKKAITEKPHKCNLCSRFFSSLNGVTHHKRSCHGSFMCTKCNTEFKYKEQLIRHRLQDHRTKRGKKKKIFVCSICDKWFGKRRTYKQHISTHKSYSCDLCNNTFETELNLNAHKKIHLENKPNETF